MASKRTPAKRNYFPSLLTGLMMMFVGFIFTLTGIGAIIGAPVFLMGFVVAGFFYMQVRRQERDA
jgi:thiamine transporter ThiT